MRAFNRVLSLLLSVVLLSGGLLTVAEVAAAVAGRQSLLVPLDRWGAALRATSLSAQTALFVSGGMAAVGLILFVAEVRPWPKRRLVMRTTGHGSWWLLRRPLERQLSRTIVSETPATAAKVRIKASRRRWKARVKATGTPEAHPAIKQRIEAFLRGVGAPEGLVVRLHVKKDRRVM